MNARCAAALLLAGALLAATACGPRSGTRASPALPDLPGPVEEEGPALFEDITARSGLTFTHRNGEEANHLTILESLGGGVGVLDYDGDGLLDLFITGGGDFLGKDRKEIVGLPCRLYKNLGNGRFRDVTAEVGLDKLAGGKPWFYTHGVAVGDFDRDGWPDLLVTGYGRVALFRNVGGRRFEDVTAPAGLDKGITWATSAAFADLDGDGWPDLYVCQYLDWSWRNHTSCKYDGKTPDVCSPMRFPGLTHKVYRNNGDGTFTDQSATCGLVPGGPQAGKGLGVLAVDVDGDGRPDLFVANDTTDRFLYLNRSRRGQIRFEERALACGVARDGKGNLNGSMGVDAGDHDGSGKPSLWVTNFEGELHGLFRNISRPGHLSFTFDTGKAGIAGIGERYVAWGTGFIDFDLDGWEDLFVSNGHVLRYPGGEGVTRRQKAVLLMNHQGKFRPARSRLGPYGQQDHLGRGVGLVDLDNDGRVDLVLAHLNEPVALLRNVADPKRHWLGVQLVGANHADVVGARVVLEAGGRRQTRFARGGGSYASSSDRRLVFGLGETARLDRLTVTWPDGKRQEWTGLAVDRYHVLSQGEKQARPYRVKK
jgi:hypothetical protein